MLIVSFRPKMPENYDIFCSASETNKQNPRDRASDFPSFFGYKHITSLKNHLLLAQGTGLPAGFGATFPAGFVLIYRSREFPLSVDIVFQNLSLLIQSILTS